MTPIDWTVFDKYPENTCECMCGVQWMSHGKFVAAAGGVVSRKPCPGCGRSDNIRAMYGTPETWSVKE